MATSEAAKPDAATTAAFLIVVVVLGANFVAVRFSNDELAPFWGAAMRFAAASLVLFGLVVLRRVPLPRGAALAGSLLFGVLAFGATYAFAYWSLLGAPSATVSILFATIPLSTLFLAMLHRLEPFRFPGLAGGLLALAGIGAIFREQANLDVRPEHLVAGLLGALCAAEAGIVVKRFPRSHPFANNAVAMATGSVLLLVLSAIFREAHAVPTKSSTWIALVWLILVGSVLAFVLLVHVLGKWKVSSVAYQAVLSPLVTAALAARLLGQGITPTFVVGSALVLAGVWVGALWAPKRKPEPGVARGA